MPALNVVVDLSHHNHNVDLDEAATAGIRGVIHKASQGESYEDPTYSTRWLEATRAGLMWGAYHFGTGSDGSRQAQHFLTVADPGPADLLVLDFEQNAQGPSMGIEEARAFVAHVRDATGRWPGFYSGHYIKALLGTRTDPILSKCWFWLAQYGPTPVVPANWDSWTLWQYTDGGVGPQPHIVPGIGRCARNRFNGDEAAFDAFWGAGGMIA
jgi:lysozyme